MSSKKGSFAGGASAGRGALPEVDAARLESIFLCFEQARLGGLCCARLVESRVRIIKCPDLPLSLVGTSRRELLPLPSMPQRPAHCTNSNMVMGSGFLALPKAFVSSGLVLGVAVLLACTLLMNVGPALRWCRSEVVANRRRRRKTRDNLGSQGVEGG